MQVILTQNVPHVGSLGDQVHVKDGFARNYLLPRGLAIAAGSKNARHIEHQRRRLEVMRQTAIAQARAESDRVSGLPIVIKAKSGPGGKLFGSVTSRDLQAAYTERGVTLDRKAFVLHSLVKNTGTFKATVRLHTDVKVEVSFRVEAKDLTPEEQAALAAELAAAAAAKEAKAAQTAAAAAATEAAQPAEGGAAAEGKRKGKVEGAAEEKAGKGAKGEKKAAADGDAKSAKGGKKAAAASGEKPQKAGKESKPAKKAAKTKEK